MCNIATIFFDFLNNSAVGAAVGAFLAYFLVAATDWRRRNRRKQLIPIRVRILRNIAERKHETAKTNIAMIRENEFTSAPVMKFPIEDLRALQTESLDVLSAAQINALDALIYWFEAIDELFEEAQINAKALEKLVIENAPTSERSKAGGKLLRNFEEVERNLPMLLTLCDCYLDNNPEGILKFKYIRKTNISNTN